ncbi:nuclear transport factor 2 family protein [Pseudoalteromonas phenolica]|uniref:SnoaL-like domain-containing protein n=1 Tax=Pseudoalteromonas phenolica TaxID=161398 RepID=A0A0S2K3L6_9GAMM|nr:nuclear transport factor 2 family protein [Pseudoalteromonas phenolica]ALO42660.1 hypothetical protein PP2015_2163 [Pseudoalteromonas phenolica]MBE0356234.1 hypothetical protein [Pseudoalteromonas phenolica O-BC30]RXE91473.1 hypothetical protein D9981_22475 [Pseudoalteromonas phenolica O-BC30]TMO58234.1 cell division regulator GpsB [Pseudoalteromonas phenolica]
MKLICTLLSSAILFGSSSLSTSAFAASSTLEAAKSVTDIVDIQLKAYNNRDIDAFLATYHKDVEIHYFPEGLKYKGIDKLKEEYELMFNRVSYLNAKITNREIQGRFVVDTEEVTAKFMYQGKEHENKFKAIATYEVEDGLIKRVLFLK